MTAADRPSVTDDARAALADALTKYEAEIERAQNSGQGAAIAILAGASLAHAVRDALAAGRAETTTATDEVHLMNPDDGASFCDQPATIITEAGDTRPVCQTCHRRAMKHVRSGWCPCVSGRPQDCSPEKWPLSIRHGQGRAETTTATDDAVARVIWYAPTVDPGGVTVRDSETIAQALTERFHITERQQ